MAMQYFCCYYSYYSAIRNMTNEQVGGLFRALFQYGFGEEVGIDGAEKVAFDLITGQMDRDSAKYNEKCAKNRANASVRKRSVANGSDGSQGKGKGKRKGKEEDKDNYLQLSNDNLLQTDIENVVSFWNNQTMFAKISRMASNSTRYKNLSARIKQYGYEEVIKALEIANESSFLLGNNNTGWTMTFDWFVKPNNFVKVLDGNYTDKDKKNTKNDWDDIFDSLGIE